MMSPLAALLLLATASSGQNAETAGLTAFYPCDEGGGTVLRDATGRGHDATISGAAFTPFGEGSALRLDGVDDFGDCGRGPEFDMRDAVSLDLWVYPETLPAGEAGVVGKDYGSYVLTHYQDGRFWWYISGGGNSCKAAVPLKGWHHIAATFDGELLKLYVDGQLADTQVSTTNRISPGERFWIGKSAGDAQFTRGAHFAGLVDEIRVYRRALTADEVVDHYRTTHLSHRLSARCLPYPFMRELRLRLDTQGLGRLPEGSRPEVSDRRGEGGGPLLTETLGPLTSWRTEEFTIAFDGRAAGEYRLTAQAVAEGPIGRAAVVRFAWSGVGSDSGGGEKLKPLNNLVTELLDIGTTRTQESHAFTTPRDGWVFVSSQESEGARVVLTRPDREDVLVSHQAANHAPLEAMRWLPRGDHRILVNDRGGRMPGRLIIRAIPELIFAKFGAHPHVKEYGLYDWGFLGRHVLPHLNTMVGNGSEEQRPFAEEWQGHGKRWITESGVPGLRNGEPVDPDEVFRFWTGQPGMSDPLLDGIIADEFWAGDLPQYPGWTEAVRRINAADGLRDKSFYPYCGSMSGSEPSREFMRAVLDGGNRFAWERYLPEQRTERAARLYLDSALREEALQWETTLPGSVERMVVCIGYFSQPPETLDVDPAVDHKVYLDMQFHLIANDPAFRDVAGLMTYLSSYSDEETVRWAGKLFRHYGIEGRAERMTDDPYELPHVRNPDFEEGLDGWDVSSADEGSVGTGTMAGYSWLQGRYPKTSQGDTFLTLERSDKGPNRVSQTIRGLRPGRVYSLRAYVADIDDLDTQQTLGVSIEASGVELLQDRSLRHVFPNCYSHHLGDYDDKRRAWMNYHWQIFRATGDEARLTVSDWASNAEPGGPIGQRLAVNFVQVQPYDTP